MKELYNILANKRWTPTATKYNRMGNYIDVLLVIDDNLQVLARFVKTIDGIYNFESICAVEYNNTHIWYTSDYGFITASGNTSMSIYNFIAKNKRLNALFVKVENTIPVLYIQNISSTYTKIKDFLELDENILPSLRKVQSSKVLF